MGLYCSRFTKKVFQLLRFHLNKSLTSILDLALYLSVNKTNSKYDITPTSSPYNLYALNK